MADAIFDDAQFVPYEQVEMLKLGDNVVPLISLPYGINDLKHFEGVDFLVHDDDKGYDTITTIINHETNCIITAPSDNISNEDVILAVKENGVNVYKYLAISIVADIAKQYGVYFSSGNNTFSISDGINKITIQSTNCIPIILNNILCLVQEVDEI